MPVVSEALASATYAVAVRTCQEVASQEVASFGVASSSPEAASSFREALSQEGILEVRQGGLEEA